MNTLEENKNLFHNAEIKDVYILHYNYIIHVVFKLYIVFIREKVICKIGKHGFIVQ